MVPNVFVGWESNLTVTFATLLITRVDSADVAGYIVTPFSRATSSPSLLFCANIPEQKETILWLKVLE